MCAPVCVCVCVCVCQGGDDLEALMGKAKILELKKSYHMALDLYTELTVKFTWFVPALVEKARLLLAQGDWEQVGHVCVRGGHVLLAQGDWEQVTR